MLSFGELHLAKSTYYLLTLYVLVGKLKLYTYVRTTNCVVVTFSVVFVLCPMIRGMFADEESDVGNNFKLNLCESMRLFCG